MKLLVFFLLLLTLTNFADVLGDFPIGVLIEVLLLFAVSIQLSTKGVHVAKLGFTSLAYLLFYSLCVIRSLNSVIVSGYSELAPLVLMLYFFVVLSYLHADDRKLDSLFWTVVLVVSFEAVYDVVAFALLDRNFLEDSYRSTGFGMQSNALGLLYVSAFPYGIFLFNRTNHKMVKFLLLLVAVLAIAALLITKSRSGFVLFAVLISSYLAIRRHYAFIIPAGVLSFLLYTINPVGLFDRFLSIDADREFRILLIDRSIELARSNPLIGVGFRQAGTYTSDLVDKALNLGFHNSYLSISAEFGIPLFVLFLTLILSSLWSLSHHARAGNQYAEAAFVSMLVCAFSALTNHTVWYTMPFALPFIVGAIISYRECDS